MTSALLYINTLIHD